MSLAVYALMSVVLDSQPGSAQRPPETGLIQAGALMFSSAAS
ncbi:hypothetical protein FBY35_3833 [Streptomyces sp. SLBN-118]|nr:hypothetical protein [Streptomyces sp. SLBN-118]TQK42428.1 hypothetical protein FBY35_3833 [Streptomyces sp. SLBN-118]